MRGVSLKARFSKVHIEVSSICNLKCSFCPEVVREKKFMDLELFERALSEVVPLADQVALHLMGEPLTHPKFEALLLSCERARAPIFLVTNGVLLRDKHKALLLKPGFRQINFSLHAFADNFSDKDPTQYLENIFDFVDRALKERPELYINFRLWNLQDHQNSTGANSELLRQVEEHYDFKLKAFTDVRQQKSYKILGRLYLHFDTEFVWPDLSLPSLGTRGTCYGLTSHFGILVDGTVVPCCLDKEGDIALGNIRRNAISEILESPRAKAILDGFSKGQLTESLCQRCQYIERFAEKAKARASAHVTHMP